MRGIAYRIRNQIDQYSLQHNKIAAHPTTIRNDPERQFLLPCGGTECCFGSLEQLCNREFSNIGDQNASIQTRNIKKLIKKFVYCSKRVINATNNPSSFGCFYAKVQRPNEET